MKIIVAPNAFKGSLTAEEAAEAMAAGARRAAPGCRVVCVPLSDGGDGLIEVFARAMSGRVETAKVTGPRGRPVTARFCLVPPTRTAVVEMAEASGLALLSKRQRDPMKATTYGTGELIRRAVRAGARRVVVGVGGSATCDGGAGMAAALGARFLDSRGRAFVPAGGSLHRIARIDARRLDSALRGVRFEAVCDVNNPLLGRNGAARVFAPQKGATRRQTAQLEAGLRHYARLLKRDLGKDVTRLRGGGAGGGLPVSLRALFGARIRPGADVALELTGLPCAIAGADLVLTGEGRIDAQTLFGKAPARVAALAKRKRVPCMAFAGSVGVSRHALHGAGFTGVFPIRRPRASVAQAMANAAPLLAAAVERAVRACVFTNAN